MSIRYAVDLPFLIQPKQGDRSWVERDPRNPFKLGVGHRRADAVDVNCRHIQMYAGQTAPLELLKGPIEATFAFEYPWLKAHRNRNGPIPKGTAPDVDNLLKQICDACEGMFYPNDGRIWRIEAEKAYTGRERTRATFRECPNYDTTEGDVVQQNADVMCELLDLAETWSGFHTLDGAARQRFRDAAATIRGQKVA